MGNLYSAWAELSDVEVTGKTTPPEDVTNFQLVIQGSKAFLTWDQVSDLDVLHGGNYWLRYTSDTTANWGSSTDITRYIPGNTSSYLAPLLSGRYLLKAVDSSGNESISAIAINTNFADILNLNAVYTSTQHPNFGNDTSDTGVNDSNTTNITYDSDNQAIELATATLATGTHDLYLFSGTNTDIIDTYDSTQNSITDSGATDYVAANIFDSATGNFDDRTGNFDDTVHTTNKLVDENATFTSSLVGYIVRNVDDDVTATVTALDNSTTLTLDADIFQGANEQYRFEVQPNILRDLTVDFTTATVSLVGRTVRLDDNSEAIITAVDSNGTECTLDSDLFEDGHNLDYHIEWGPNQIFDSSATFDSSVVGKTIYNTTQSTSTTISAFVSTKELTLTDPIFEHRDGDSYSIQIVASDNKLRDTGASFDDTMLNRLVVNTTTDNNTSVVSVDSSTELTLSSNIFTSDQDGYRIEGDVASTGYYYFTDDSIDLGTTYTSRVIADYKTDSFDNNELFDVTTGLFDSRTGLFDGSDISSTNAQLEVRTTTDDPASSGATWSAWTKLFIGDYTARAFEFRLKLTADTVTQNIRVTGLSATIDMPDTVKRAYGVTTDSGTNNGTKVITYTTPFKTTPTVGITLTTTDDNNIYHQISSSDNEGFTVTFYDNSTSQASQETFNWISVGY